MKKGHRVKNVWVLACVSGLLAVIFMILLSLTTAKLLQAGMLPMSSLQLMSIVILCLASAGSAFVTGMMGKQKVMLLCLITATIFFLSIAILNGVLQRGQFYRIGQTAISIYLSAILVGLICAKKKHAYG